MRAHLDELIDSAEFTRRHTAPTDDERRHMLAVIGEDSLESLLAHTVPASIRMADTLELGAPRSPESVLGELRDLAARNVPRTSLIGMGYYGTITPPVIVRNVLESPAWYTAYTPYQPEISQGRLEALLNFQTMVAELTGFDLANASLLDEATAAAEAMTMCRRLSTSSSHRFVVHHDTHPQTIAVLATRAAPIGIDLVVGDADAIAGECFGALFSLPTSSGSITDWRHAISAVLRAGGLAVVATDLMACMLTVPPGHLSADIAVGSAQRFGVSMGFGGPHAAFIAASESVARALPGRLVGVSTDTEGRPAMRLALQTREQHIRREKATSNICTAQVLLANIAGLYAAWHGPQGLRRIAERIHRFTSMAVDALKAAGFELVNDTWFDTVQVRCDAVAVRDTAAAAGLDLRFVDDATIGFSFDETITKATLAILLAVFGADFDASDKVTDNVTDGIPHRRTDEFLTQSVFARYHTEHEMLRYLRRLSDKDLALDRTMIPLGSCTMKLNATVEMEPLTWPGLADMHPFSPDEATVGIRTMIAQLEAMLVAITGYDAVSLQPNAGSQGELAGLLAIHAYHRSRGDRERDVCLIPSSAHGTNAASAVMAGLKVVVVRCDDGGNIDLADLENKAAAAADSLAAAMVTYPSTHGVFEARIRDVCEIVHRHGGQVYVDGANLNAMVGLAQPGQFGADVSHLNLHKTFCIPHGGGGPGVGPVAVRAHLAEFLPAHPLMSAGRPVGAVSAAPFGSASILSISWVYIALMGASGLAEASSIAILNANYIATRLHPHFPVLYTGEHGRVAHECIIDLRPITKATGVTVDDVAKRLIDYGLHAPTMSFPVAGTLMVEPTESESLFEVDRFCDAMIAIKAEIDDIADGVWPLDDSPLRNAPHTAEDLIGEWKRPYDRQLGAYPLPQLRVGKYFPPVSRIDSAYGDRNLICSCEPLEVLAASTH
ncbi:MAG TPA: aminomethyl-transferring glycine dehydrogenase [Ilumatobacteraceae bacterium]|nr:aminomethyl-transferring glycine dehydrogenase [Ilumatobacteraceae bacterium]